MFRSDRDALAGKVDDLRQDNERLRAENDAMRAAILARRTQEPQPHTNLYRGGDAGLTHGERAALSTHTLKAFPVWAVVVLHVLTFGAFSFFHFNTMHERLPRGEYDDPSAVKAIGLHLVPYFGYYWLFFNALRLTDRINLQLRLRGEQPQVSRGLVIASGVLTVAAYLIVVAPILWLFVAISMQRAVNHIVALDADRADADARQMRMRIPEVRDLPGPDDVTAMAEQEAIVAEQEAARRAL